MQDIDHQRGRDVKGQAGLKGALDLQLPTSKVTRMNSTDLDRHQGECLERSLERTAVDGIPLLNFCTRKEDCGLLLGRLSLRFISFRISWGSKFEYRILPYQTAVTWVPSVIAEASHQHSAKRAGYTPRFRASSIAKNSLFGVVSCVGEDPRVETAFFAVGTLEDKTFLNRGRELGVQQDRPLFMEQFLGTVGEEGVSGKFASVPVFEMVVQVIGKLLVDGKISATRAI